MNKALGISDIIVGLLDATLAVDKINAGAIGLGITLGCLGCVAIIIGILELWSSQIGYK